MPRIAHLGIALLMPAGDSYSAWRWTHKQADGRKARQNVTSGILPSALHTAQLLSNLALGKVSNADYCHQSTGWSHTSNLSLAGYPLATCHSVWIAEFFFR
jgi:hypothetical protein